MQKYKASIIVSIYNNIRALKCLLDSLKIQSERQFEIIISEDAEHKEVAEFCYSYEFQNDYQHLTQPDIGWQKNRALNRAIHAAKSDNLIFVDGDCILHPRFVEQHIELLKKGDVVAGKRVKLNEELSDLLLESVDNYKVIEQRLKGMLFSKDKGGNSFVEEGVFIAPESMLGRVIHPLRGMRNLKGCNMSFTRKAILKINGFDEEYALPAIGEDIDLVWRFKAVGYDLVSARNRAVQYHLYHRENWSDQSENIAIMERNQRDNRYFCPQGLIK